MKTLTKVLIGIGAAALVLAVIKYTKARSFDAQAWLDSALTKSWSVAGEIISPARTRIALLPDGNVLIGDGYKGHIVDDNTIITTERNGIAEPALTWTAV